ncbi:MAG: hypothetical protein AAB071_04825 [Bacteroidota bacterium]
MLTYDYLPRGEAQLSLWLENFSAKLPNYAGTLALTGEDVDKTEQRAQTVKAQLAEVESAKRTTKSIVEAKDVAIAETIAFTRTLVNRMKVHPNYNSVIAENLGLVPPEQTVPPDGYASVVPEFSAMIVGNLIRLDWKKLQFDGIIIEGKRGNETTWTRLDRDTRSPFDDTRPNLVPNVPEARYYRIRYFLNEVEVGQWSDGKKITCSLDATN